MPLRVVTGVEELRGLVGQEIGVSDWFVVEQSRINAFAEAIEDRQWIHVDLERAQTESVFGTTIAHGFLTLSLVSHLVRQAVRIDGNFVRTLNYGLDRVRFPSPVPSGSRVRARCTALSVEDILGGIQVCWSVSIEVDGVIKPSLVAQWLVRYYH